MGNPDPRHAHRRPPFAQQEQAAPGSEAQMSPAPDYGEDSYRGQGRLTGQVALITGGDGGIGRAVALAFAREGADIVISYLDEKEDAQAARAAVERAGRKCVTVAGDIGSEAHCQTLVATAIKHFGHIDVLVNNAAYQGKSVEGIAALTTERVERTFRTNIVAMFTLIRLSLPHMQPGSTIINTSSIQAYSPSAPILDYASSKGAIVALTKGLAQELLPSHGIRVNSVAPGPVWTPLIVQSFPPDKSAHFGETSPMGRPAQPSELAPAYVFLASDESRFVNGEVLGVTGGGLLV